jgi:hypothetical protein
MKSHSHKFLELVADSLLEIVFVGHPIKLQVPAYKTCKYKPSAELTEVFEVEVWITGRFINRGYK